MFATLGHEQTMDIVDSILVEDTLEDAKHDGVLTKIRTAVKKQYATIESSSGEPSVVYEPPVYTEQTEDGYVGLPPPLG